MTSHSEYLKTVVLIDACCVDREWLNVYFSVSQLPVILLVSLKSRILKLGPIETILNLTGKHLVKLYSSDPSQTGILKYLHPLFKDLLECNT